MFPFLTPLLNRKQAGVQFDRACSTIHLCIQPKTDRQTDMFVNRPSLSLSLCANSNIHTRTTTLRLSACMFFVYIVMCSLSPHWIIRERGFMSRSLSPKCDNTQAFIAGHAIGKSSERLQRCCRARRKGTKGWMDGWMDGWIHTDRQTDIHSAQPIAQRKPKGNRGLTLAAAAAAATAAAAIMGRRSLLLSPRPVQGAVLVQLLPFTIGSQSSSIRTYIHTPIHTHSSFA